MMASKASNTLVSPRSHALTAALISASVRMAVVANGTEMGYFMATSSLSRGYAEASCSDMPE